MTLIELAEGVTLDEVKAKTQLDSVTALVDAKHVMARLDDSKEAREQVAFADLRLNDLTVARNDGTVQNLNDRRHDLYALTWARRPASRATRSDSKQQSPENP